jgi:hypothetical protein
MLDLSGQPLSARPYLPWHAGRDSGTSVRMPRKPKEPSGHNVVDLDAKRSEKLTDELITLAQHSARLMDEQVELIVLAYDQWERQNPELALRASDKMAMVRLGFVGPGGFDRCHETGRRPWCAFVSEDGEPADDLPNDRNGPQVLMCPAMESRRCQGVWRGMRMPPCYLLLLEVHRGLGGGSQDSGVHEVLDDFGKWQGPEEYAESFVRAEQLIRRYRQPR